MSVIYAREDGFVTMFTPEYRGLMGEIREADLLYLNATAYLNGEFAADMTTWNDLRSGVPERILQMFTLRLFPIIRMWWSTAMPDIMSLPLSSAMGVKTNVPP